MKRIYQKPETMVVLLHHQQNMLLLTSVNQATSEVGIGYGGASTNDVSDQGARVKDYNVWNDEWGDD